MSQRNVCYIVFSSRHRAQIVCTSSQTELFHCWRQTLPLREKLFHPVAEKELVRDVTEKRLLRFTVVGLKRTCVQKLSSILMLLTFRRLSQRHCAYSCTFLICYVSVEEDGKLICRIGVCGVAPRVTYAVRGGETQQERCCVSGAKQKLRQHVIGSQQVAFR